MDFLNTAVAQARDLMLSMTPGARIVAGLLLAVVVLSIGFLFQQSAAGPDEYLFGGAYLSSSELNKIDAAIAGRNLSGHVREGNRIRVPAAQKHEYLAAVADANALPRSFHDLMEKSLESGSIWESRETRQQRMQILMSQKLSEIVRTMYWVEDAMVLVDEQASSGFTRPRQVTSSVTVEPVPGEALTPERRNSLQQLLAHSVAGLRPDDVAVTSLGDDVGYGGKSRSPESFDDEYLRAQAEVSEYTRDAIANLLRFIPGVHVEVNAILDNTSEDLMRTIKPDEKTAIIREVTSKDAMERTVSDGGGRPGLEAQGPGREGANLAQQQDSDTTKNQTSDIQSFAGYVDQQVRKSGYVPTAVYATVAVPRKYLEDVWRQRNNVPEGEDRVPDPAEMTNIQEEKKAEVENLVNQLLPGHLDGEDKYKYVTVQFVDTISRRPILPPSLASTAMAWTERNWGTLSMAGLAMFSLLMLRSMVKTPLPEASALPTLKSESGVSESGAKEMDEEVDEVQRDRLRLKKAASLKDDLVEIVREDPDAAATILRGWISRAA